MASYVEAITNLSPNEGTEILLISIGTGSAIESVSYETSKGWGAANWLKPLINATMDGVSATTSYMLSAMAKREGLNLNYYRLDPKVDPKKSAMDDPSFINYWEKLAVEFIEANEQILDEIATSIDSKDLDRSPPTSRGNLLDL